MENINKRRQGTFYQYEFLGMALLTLSCNFCGFEQGKIDFTFESATKMYFLVSVWCWDLSCAHFNSAITIGRLTEELVKDVEIKKKSEKINVAMKIIFV